jgi:hypothetical protein
MESMLIDLRHEMANSFLKTRNHLSLWNTITEKIYDVLKVKFSTTQAIYKYNALKKRWKEVIDSPSGSAAKKFPHKRAFDEYYGTKCRKPAFVIDTDDTDNESTSSQSSEVERTASKGSSEVERTARKGSSEVERTARKGSSEVERTARKGKDSQRKRKMGQEDFANILEKHHSDFARMHDEKMARFDRLINLIEMDIKNKTNQSCCTNSLLIRQQVFFTAYMYVLRKRSILTTVSGNVYYSNIF